MQQVGQRGGRIRCARRGSGQRVGEPGCEPRVVQADRQRDADAPVDDALRAAAREMDAGAHAVPLEQRAQQRFARIPAAGIARHVGRAHQRAMPDHGQQRRNPPRVERVAHAPRDIELRRDAPLERVALAERRAHHLRLHVVEQRALDFRVAPRLADQPPVVRRDDAARAHAEILAEAAEYDVRMGDDPGDGVPEPDVRAAGLVTPDQLRVPDDARDVHHERHAARAAQRGYVGDLRERHRIAAARVVAQLDQHHRDAVRPRLQLLAQAREIDAAAEYFAAIRIEDPRIGNLDRGESRFRRVVPGREERDVLQDRLALGRKQIEEHPLRIAPGSRQHAVIDAEKAARRGRIGMRRREAGKQPARALANERVAEMGPRIADEVEPDRVRIGLRRIEERVGNVGGRRRSRRVRRAGRGTAAGVGWVVLAASVGLAGLAALAAVALAAALVARGARGRRAAGCVVGYLDGRFVGYVEGCIVGRAAGGRTRFGLVAAVRRARRRGAGRRQGPRVVRLDLARDFVVRHPVAKELPHALLDDLRPAVGASVQVQRIFRRAVLVLVLMVLHAAPEDLRELPFRAVDERPALGVAEARLGLEQAPRQPETEFAVPLGGEPFDDRRVCILGPAERHVRHEILLIGDIAVADVAQHDDVLEPVAEIGQVDAVALEQIADAHVRENRIDLVDDAFLAAPGRHHRADLAVDGGVRLRVFDDAARRVAPELRHEVTQLAHPRPVEREAANVVDRLHDAERRRQQPALALDVGLAPVRHVQVAERAALAARAIEQRAQQRGLALRRADEARDEQQAAIPQHVDVVAVFVRQEDRRPQVEKHAVLMRVALARGEPRRQAGLVGDTRLLDEAKPVRRRGRAIGIAVRAPGVAGKRDLVGVKRCLHGTPSLVLAAPAGTRPVPRSFRARRTASSANCPAPFRAP
ncbi:Uncharacterised protein [Burkholderia pseudomallei]|nr:Uncharacterised protein [Burkholderia pseudomallei]